MSFQGESRRGAAELAPSPGAWLMALLLLMLLTWPARPLHAKSFNDSCEARLPPLPVTVVTTPIAYKLDLSLPHKEIAQLAGPAKTGAYVLGLTKARFSTRITYRANLMQDRVNQKECLLPAITVTLSYPSVVVYIGSEFAEGSCSYREILTHELRHVQAFQQHMAELETAVREAMTERFGAPIYSATGQSLSLLSQEINSVWKPFILAEQRKVQALQKLVDSPEESRRVVRACGGELRKTILDGRNEAAAAEGSY
ncbi:hypothetical protein [Lacisediminimonas sp.]|uniref:hypothetical protein n=1 Tax=Lacisediminimonas sp. TaxID=3060582 RepID=UPI002716022E|nr:hypothetical protein [Lacisediminimonas sp.]MDO8300197.1 hypothetical protein [Lacisediminimonas sp.]